jgi:thioredoxin-related protein
MKLVRRLILAILCIAPGILHGQVEFIEIKTLEEMQAARKQASDQMLMLFVDVYATWCGPCKMMDSEVFANPAVSDYMKDHYLSLKVDGESDFGRIYASEQKLQGYPSMFIFSDEGERVSSIVGYTPPEEMLSTLRSVKEGFGKIKTYRALYRSGKLESEEFADYIRLLRDMGNQEEADRLSEEYMERVMGLKLSDNDIRVVAFHMDMDDVWWEGFASDQERLKRVLGEDYMLAMEKIYNNTLVKAVDLDRIDLISKMANEMAPLVEQETISWDLRSLPFIQFYYYTNKIEDLISYVDERFATDRKDDHRWLFGAASQITDMDQQYLTEELLRKGLQWYAACIALDAQFDYYFYEGMVHFFLRDRQNARSSFQNADALATTQEQRAMVAQVMGYIESE